LPTECILITGAGSGIGKSVALRLEKENGLLMVLVARSQRDIDKVEKQVKTDGNSAVAVPCDVSSPKEVDELLVKLDSNGLICTNLIHCAGIGQNNLLVDTDFEEYERVMNTNMRSTYLLTKAFLPQMLQRKTGKIILIGSVTGFRGAPQETIYAASKFAQWGFAQALDAEVREQGVKVTYLAPGGVKTKFDQTIGRPEKPDHELLTPESVAEAVSFVLQQSGNARVPYLAIRPMSEGMF
jgi:short-subunit dehydrogenase